MAHRGLRQRIGARLRQMREARGFTQQEIAGVLGLHRPAVSVMESGVRATTADELWQLADLYGVSMDWFVQQGPVEAGTHVIRRPDRWGGVVDSVDVVVSRGRHA